MPSKYGVNVVAIRSGKNLLVSPTGDDLIHDGDLLVVIGENSYLEKLNKRNPKNPPKGISLGKISK